MSETSGNGDDFSALISYTRSGETGQSASSTSNQEHDFLDFLGVAQSLKIDFLPITWQPALDKVGEGGTAVIRQALINIRMTFIFKHLKRPRSAMERTRNLRALIAEISILGHPIIRSHPNIASIEGICWDVVLGDGEEVWPVLVFEKTQHGDLNRFMTSGPGKELDTKNRLDMLFDVALAVRDLHTTGIVHGDIKPDNILVFFSENDGRYMARVMDFGYSTLFRTENDSITMPNSGLWTAPEQHHRKISPSQARKMDAYSFGILCVWVLFYNKEANRDRNFKKDLEYSQRELSSYTSGLLKASVDFEDREKDNMQKIFRSTLAQDPADRSASFNEFLDLLSQDRALHSASPADMRPIPHEDFQITSSLHQLIEAHYSVRYYLAKCLEERESQSSTSQCHTLNLAVCYELGIGVRQDIKRSRSLLGIHGISIEDLEHKIEQVKKITGSQQFQKGIFRTFLEQGHFNDFDLSQQYREEQRASEAESRYQEEVEAMGSVLGEDHHLVQELQVQLSLLMSSEGRWKDAERLQVQMIELDERGTSDRLGTLLAMTYAGQGRWDKAEKLQVKVLKARERLLGTEHPKILTSKNNLALIHWNLGRWKEAEELEVQVVETSKRVFGEDHPSTLINTTNLAATYRKQRRWEEAKKLDLQVTESGKKVLGMEHPDTLNSIGNLASTYQSLGRWKEAEELQVSVMEMTKRVLGAEHPETLLSINNLAVIYLHQGRRKEAEELQVQAMEARKRVLGMEHSGTLASMNNLAMTYVFQERWEEAEELQVHVMKTSKMVLGTEHEDTLTSMANLVLTYLNQGRLDEAEELQVYVRKTSKKVLGAEHPNTLISMNNLAMIYKELERWQEAEDLETEATEIESRLHQMTVPTDEGSMNEPSYPTEDATQGPFSSGSSGFHVDYTCRESVKRLKKLCFPELLKSEKARKSAQYDASKIDRPWIKAQLQHYGINFSPDIDLSKAKALLRTSVTQGLCDMVPPQVLKIKATLKEAYRGKMNAYRDNMKAYRVQELPKRIQKFEACTTPTEEAGCDASLFLRKYFLDEKGNSDRTKTPELVLLPGYFDKSKALTGRTERIPALHVAYGGQRGADNVTVVGWNRARVNEKARQIDLRQNSGPGSLRLDQKWDRQMMSHHEHVEELRSRADNPDPKSGSSFETHQITGNYLVNCEAIQHDWPVFSKQLHLRFYRSGRLAIFDLGIVVGLMVLGKTQQDVSEILEDGSWDTDSSDEEDSGDENERGNLSSDEEKSNAEQASGHNEDSNHNSGDESDTSPIHSTLHQPPKRQEMKSSHPRRVYFQWRGYNTMSGAIQFDPQNRNTGYLDFADDDATGFKGNILMEATMRSPISFQGYKVPGLTGPLTMNWNALSHLASERAKLPEHVW